MVSLFFILFKKDRCFTMEVMREYTAVRKIASYELNVFGKLRLSAMPRICQETAEEHLSMYQLDHKTLMRQQHLAFLILRVGIQIHRMPRDGETISVLTRPEGNSGAQFYRSYHICCGGEACIDMIYSNILVDGNTHKIVLPHRLDHMEIDIKQTLSPKEKLQKIKMPEDMELWGVRQIRFSDLDFNGHLSNSIYGDIIEDYLPGNYRCGQNGSRKQLYKLQINYIKESKLKEDMLILGKETQREFYMTGSVKDTPAFTCKGQFRV